MKIVILNGRYGIEVEHEGKKNYIDLRHKSYRWERGSVHFPDCWGTLENAEAVIALIRSFEGEITPYEEAPTTFPGSCL